ncbi:MAG TPA: aminodeoxychorismate synthase component I [Rhodanobacteraceae bacterium]|nr:aminodeoxychorismate synthase component I [Rhodanobacteraceae bacterium]
MNRAARGIASRRIAGLRDLLPLAGAQPERYPALLESAAPGPCARWDILFAFPEDSLTLARDGVVRDAWGNDRGAPFLDALDAGWLAGRDEVSDNSGLPFTGGWVFYLGYELAGEVEPSLALPVAQTTQVPVALALRCPAAILVDRAECCTWLVAEPGRGDLLDSMQHDLDAAASAAVDAPLPALRDLQEDDPQRFLDGVARVHEYLRAGDTFQVNLSRAWRAHFDKAPTPAALYASLRKANPAPFAGLLQQPDWAIASSSPERLLQVRDGVAQTRPIAGTRPRVAGDDAAARIAELLGHAKERAEHVMLVDLERNDLGRVCVPGSVRVDEMMTVESYAHVHHIVSNVSGRLRADVTPGQAIAALFPGGTITGCPKVRCMQIIAELEGVARGAYTGALGYLSRNGNLDSNILIRTMVLEGGRLVFRAGAGIVVNSEAERELAETRAKAHGLLRALEVAAT